MASLVKNIMSGTAVDGIAVSADAVSTSVEKNEVSTSGDDGIQVDTPDATLTKNLVIDHHDLGIEAVADVKGSGNVAFGIGNPLQCTGVVCLGVS